MHPISDNDRNASKLKSGYIGASLMMKDDKRTGLGDLLKVDAPSKNLGAQTKSCK